VHQFTHWHDKALKEIRLQNVFVLSASAESQNILDSKLKIAVAFASVLLVAFIAPVSAVEYNPGVSVGDYVKFGSWYALNLPPEYAYQGQFDFEKMEVVVVSGKEVSWRMTGQMKNGSAILGSGETYVVDVETGATNYTHSVLGPIIGANLNEGDKVQAGSISVEVNKTEFRTYLNVSRPVNILVYEVSGVGKPSGAQGASAQYTSTSTFVYDKASGMMLETENRITWFNITNPAYIVPTPIWRWIISGSVTETNIFSSSLPPQIPVGIMYAVAAVVVVAPIGTAVVVLRRRKQPEAKTKMLEAKAMDLAYNLCGVNRGECYLADSLEHCVKVVCDLHSRGVSALAIVREDPAFLAKTCNLQPDNVVLLSSQPIKGFKAISSLQEVSIAIMKFVKAGGGVVLLDGFEYLISRFGFNAVYMMLQEKKIEFLEACAVLLVPLNMETLDSREKGQLLSELKLL
jgi:hypothetical protein